jgi:chromosome segregation ATPase
MQLSSAERADEEELKAAQERLVVLEGKLESARQQNFDLENRLKFVQAAADSRKENEDSQKRLIAQLQNEIDGLATENSGLRNELLRVREQGVTSATAEIQQQNMIVSELRDRIDGLIDENSELRTSLRETQKRVAEGTFVSADNAALQAEYDALKSDLEEAEQTNQRLNEELDIFRTASESAVNSGDVGMQAAELRLDQAQNEIRRLGMLLKKDREQCSAEIDTLEAKLFDPAVTEMEQIKRLEQLQGRVGDAETARSVCEREVADMIGKLDSEKQKILALYD